MDAIMVKEREKNAIERLKMSVTWTSVKDDLPENDWVRIKKIGEYLYSANVLVKTRSGDVFVTKRVLSPNSTVWRWKGSLRFNASVTHWQIIVENDTELEDAIKQLFYDDRIVN